MARDRAEGIIDRIYEAAVIPERWQSVLGELSQLANSDGGLLFTSNGGGDPVVSFGDIGPVFAFPSSRVGRTGIRVHQASLAPTMPGSLAISTFSRGRSWIVSPTSPSFFGHWVGGGGLRPRFRF